jgi:hypothetical protein
MVNVMLEIRKIGHGCVGVNVWVWNHVSTLETKGQHTLTQTSTLKPNFIRVLKTASRSEATKLQVGKVYLWLVT